MRPRVRANSPNEKDAGIIHLEGDHRGQVIKVTHARLPHNAFVRRQLETASLP